MSFSLECGSTPATEQIMMVKKTMSKLLDNYWVNSAINKKNEMLSHIKFRFSTFCFRGRDEVDKFKV